jgi:hypothetical protein
MARRVLYTTGTFKVGEAQGSLAANTTASNNTAVGTYRRLCRNHLRRTQNTGIGGTCSVSTATTTADDNAALGYQALTANTTGGN